MKKMLYLMYIFSTAIPLMVLGSSTQKIKLTSYNIKYGSMEGLDQIVKVLRHEQADVIALQEVDNNRKRSGYVNQTKYIANKLKMNYVFRPAETYGKEEYGNSIISRFPIQDVKVISLPKGSPGRAGGGEKRIALATTIAPDPNNHAHDFIFISVHAAVFNSDDPRRGKSGIVINQFINRPENFYKPAFLAGDINERFKYLKKDLTESDQDELSISNLYRKWGFNEKKIRTSNNKNKQIDYVLSRYRGRYKPVGYEGQKFLREASDHTAISLVIKKVTDPEDFSFTGEDVIIIPGLELEFKKCRKRIVLNHRIEGAKTLGEQEFLNPTYLASGRGPAANKKCWNTLTEAKAIADSLEEKGISPSLIHTEEKSTTTVENAKYTPSIVERFFPKNYSINVVTSFYHMNRRSWPGEKNNSAKKLFKDKFKDNNINFYSTERFLKPKGVIYDQSFTYAIGWRSNLHARFFCDVNGDNLADLVGVGQRKIYVSLSDGKTFQPNSSWGEEFTTDKGWNNVEHVRHCKDVNGDGKDDLIGFGNKSVYVALSNGEEFEKGKAWHDNFTEGQGWNNQNHSRLIGDVNGDGMADIVGLGEKNTYVALSNGKKFGKIAKWRGCSGNMTTQCGEFTNEHVRVLADFDGDKKLDVIGFGGNVVFVMKSTGTSFQAKESKLENDKKGNKAHFTKYSGGYEGGYRYDSSSTMTDYPRGAADFNGDGKADLWAIGNDAIMIAYSNGVDFEYLGSAVWSFHRKLPGYSVMTRDAGCKKCWDGWKHPRLAGDFNGDGLTDILGIGERKAWISLFNLWGRSTLDQP